jgi:hypothetical protein
MCNLGDTLFAIAPPDAAPIRGGATGNELQHFARHGQNDREIAIGRKNYLFARSDAGGPPCGRYGSRGGEQNREPLMTLHHRLQQRAGVGRPVRVGLIGAGKFGPMFFS